ncbi:F5/8 type C domain protein [Desulfovibrio ferrophilus]|uniref:F5/8 type C domain protein n=1 Tax=Desulfovibrio ferrophilus TaxID=241368 RepID=A0A2Z6AVA7_9BACT|nr:F5/8 type C domain protein [Desulfovibrio ferrophilus]
MAEDRVSGALQLSYRIAEIRSGDEERIDSSFLRLYKVRLSKDVTSTVNFTGSFDLSEQETNEVKTTSQIPELRLTVCSDVVNGNVGYRLVEKGLHGLTTASDEERRTTESWNVDLATAALERTRIRMSYRRDRDYDYLPVRSTDTLKDDWFWTIDHEVMDSLSVGYSLRLRESQDLAADVRQDYQSNEGWLRFNDRYLDDELAISGSYTHTVSETDISVGSTPYDVETQVAPLAGLGRETTPGAGIALDPLGALIDGDLKSSVGFNIGGAGNTDRNLGLDLNRATRVDELRVYTTDATFTPADYTWALYSSDDGVFWSQISASASFVYDDEKDYFAITVPGVEKRYLKVVNTTNDATVSPIYVTEIEAYSLEPHAADSSDSDMAVTKNIQLNMNYRPKEWLQLSYDMSQIRRMEEAGADEVRHDTHNAGVRVSHNLGAYVTATGQYQRRLETQTGELDRTSDSYLANLLAQPMETLDVDLSLSRVDSREGSQEVSSNSVAQMHVGALLRKGAQLDVESGLSVNENFQSDAVTTARNLDTSLRLELTRSLTADLIHDMSWTETEQASNVTRGRTSFSKLALYYRPSRVLYLRGSYSLDQDHITGVETTRQECTLGWLLTRKLQLDTGWSLERNGSEKKIFNVDLAWTLSRMLNLRFGYDWTWHQADILTEVHQYSMDLSAKF